jgi:vancomycin resistance protein YoaR
VFSFNKVVGSWSRDQGYRKAPVSYNGQLISSWGGGVCQTSTTLYNVALLSGMVILERHPHRFSPSYVPPGRDAAVAFSSVDLRFVNPYEFPVRIEGGIEADRLVLSLWGSGKSVGVRLSQDIQEVKTPREYAIHGGTSGYARIRNTGKTGYDVVTWRLMDGRKELVSQDSYPAMQRIVEYR